MILSIFLSLIFMTLGIIHISWVMGAKFALSASLPTKLNGKRLFNPTKVQTAFVVTLLITCGYFYFLKSGLTAYGLPDWMMTCGSWIIPMVFLLRAIGEFKYIGLFKRVRDTTFGKWDTYFFSPLCLGIAIVGLLINYFQILNT